MAWWSLDCMEGSNMRWSYASPGWSGGWLGWWWLYFPLEKLHKGGDRHDATLGCGAGQRFCCRLGWQLGCEVGVVVENWSWSCTIAYAYMRTQTVQTIRHIYHSVLTAISWHSIAPERAQSWRRPLGAETPALCPSPCIDSIGGCCPPPHLLTFSRRSCRPTLSAA